ncbi:choice-of-anchor A family protein [Runella slithyformis]|uniref:Choice-of-anchor A domain-containing protein n=1 Tax=Runella slithyformis (strain ATCC 29530 / DSM 19594 / LMG 11500 / NCIMB 11436 / LSU 4) TaxID=761193 RepID=A0A7U4E8G8_RUNSL|nr:choice-of-anchor A family protein [Runella slithyformis]AEI51686.1 hypothetical protein Runsl_5395 [Runella slithyformis DSM 19594]
MQYSLSIPKAFRKKGLLPLLPFFFLAVYAFSPTSAQTQNCGLVFKLVRCVGGNCPPPTSATSAGNNNEVSDLSGYPTNTTYLPLPFSWPVNMVRGYDQTFNVIVGGNFRIMGRSQSVPSEIEGRLAVRGNFILDDSTAPYNSCYGIGTSRGSTYIIDSKNFPALLIGGAIKGSTNSFGVGGTGIAIGGTHVNNLPNFIPVTDSPGKAGTGINIDSCLSDITAKSLYWATLTATGTLSVDTLIGNNSSTIQVFNVPARKKFGFIDIPAGASVIVNVSGTTLSNVQLPAVNAVTPPAAGSPSLFRLLFNFHQATNVTFTDTFYGSAIIPAGNVTLSVGNFDGRLVIGGNLTHKSSGEEVHNHPFAGEFPCPPPCLKTNLDVSALTCAPHKQSYSVTFTLTQKNGTLKANAGALSGSNNGLYTVSNIPPMVGLKITDSLTSVCKFDIALTAPPFCHCVPSTPVGVSPSVLVCKGDTLPGDTAADRYTNVTGGFLPASATISYKPAGIAGVSDTFYEETHGTTLLYEGVIDPKTPITVTVQNCDSLINLKLKKSISTKMVQLYH